jgi:multisubunit Na+/H+ antiporter MnhG subunit
MSTRTKFILFSGILLLAYGISSRLIPVYFFWESRVLGWIVLIMALLSYWFDLRKSRIQKGKKTIWVTIGIGILILFLVIAPVTMYLLKNSDAYGAAIEELENDKALRQEIGAIKGIGLFPLGSVQISSSNGEESGHASFQIIVMGSKKYKDVVIEMMKDRGGIWRVRTIEN